MRAKVALFSFVLIGIASISFVSIKWGNLVAISTQMEIISSLRDTASLIFGVLGVWVAIVYPEALSNMFKKSKQKNDVAVVKYIFFSIRTCTFIVLYTIAASFLYPIARNIPYVIEHKEIFKIISTLVVGLSSFSLFVSLFLSLLPLESANLDIEDIHHMEEQLGLKHRNRKK